MDGFDIATDRIQAAASGVDQVGASLHREIAAMEGTLADIGAGWHSTTAAPRFAAAMGGYLDDARRLAEALISHGASLAVASRTFEQAEGAIAAATPAVTR